MQIDQITAQLRRLEETIDKDNSFTNSELANPSFMPHEESASNLEIHGFN